MELGLLIRNYGAAATPALMRSCAQRAEAAGLDALWVADHVAIPPDNAEGSGGRYVEPLVTLAHLAALTERIRLGTAVLVLPHRSALAAAKAIASLQELSADRLLLGVGVGGMPAEYQVTGVPWERRGAVLNDMLAFLHKCFAGDEVVANGQPFLFRPRPPRPPILIGGSGAHAVRRIVRFGDGWIAPRSDPDELRQQIPILQEAMAAAGRPAARVVALAALKLDDPPAAIERTIALRELGVDGIVVMARYADADGFAAILDALQTHIRPVLAA